MILNCELYLSWVKWYWICFVLFEHRSTLLGLRLWLTMVLRTWFIHPHQARSSFLLFAIWCLMVNAILIWNKVGPSLLTAWLSLKGGTELQVFLICTFWNKIVLSSEFNSHYSDIYPLFDISIGIKNNVLNHIYHIS